ncbi:FAD/NAD(P)-binding domain-containing protein [Aspergillus heteromorphus CBS 117.55]|uniref:FAD/NAD(P)-binding domain-containing protein n=1 Tax=Aspergillus heteromorphus CBS 117.55 TaxID=1448321 RepID=A0A317WVT4_9EURO|nr:FAD/NAD(P)-binding domain-containing protein [Aspergillus heteromorphus CBS 117.55]PWY88390.1 FAD/NAD(P)-binding domain-containing protein [Aspergillus heteromorphus CBS 117.55]
MAPALLSTALREQHVVILGGAYAGLSTALNLLRICDGTIAQYGKGGRGGGRSGGRGGGRGGGGGGGRGGFGGQKMELPHAPRNMPKITILDPRDGFYHTVGTPMAHTSRDFIPKPWRTWEEIPELKRESVSILKGAAVKVDPEAKSLLYVSGESEGLQQKSLDYDYLVVATGLRRPWPTVPAATTKSEYSAQAQRYIDHLQQCKSIVVIGGGAVGIEMAAEIKHRHPTKEVTLVHSRSELLSSEPLPSEFREQVNRIVEGGGVTVILENRVINVTEESGPSKIVTLQNGHQIAADEVIWATSSAAPITEFLPKESLDERGFVETLPSTHFARNIPNSDSHFAVGDVIATPGIRLAAGAVRMGKIAAASIAHMIVAGESGHGLPDAQSMPQSKGPNSGIKLVIGASGAVYDGKTGDMMWGPEVKQRVFGDDMALHRALGSLGLPLDA